MKSIRISFLLVFSVLFINNTLHAQSRAEHELHSMMIYNFLKYIQWPGDKNSGDFVIGVLKDDDVYNTLNTWYGNKERGGKKFIIKKFNSASEVTDCQLLYVGASASNQFEEVLAKIQSNATLTVSNKRGLGEKGSCINFKVIDGRLKFELNQAAMDKAGLKTSSQLAAMAILI
ncbi:MAG TPA: YfiR family protein [Fulvivirga sp.]|nr:YfiR family protein [Fulvivirga sp.]